MNNYTSEYLKLHETIVNQLKENEDKISPEMMVMGAILLGQKAILQEIEEIKQKVGFKP